MRVAFLTQTMQVSSGWGRFAYEVISRMPAQGIEPVVITEIASGYPGEHVLMPGALASLKHTLRAAWRVRKVLATCDVIHALDAYPYGLIAALGSIGHPKPLVITPVATYAIYPLEHPRLKWLMRWAYRRANVLLPITGYTGQEIEKRVSSLPPIEPVLLGVDFDRFYRAPSPVSESAPLFLSVGALKKRKGYHQVIPAIAALKEHYPQVRYVIVGDTSDAAYVSFLRAEIARFGVEDQVTMTGMIPEEDMLRLYEQCVAFLLMPENTPTNYAGFHLVYLEANAMGKAVIGATGYGSEDAIHEGENGFLVPYGDTDALVRALSKLLDNPALRASMSARAIDFARSMSWEETVRRYIRHYERVRQTQS